MFNLFKQKIKVRIAPSPTGYLHIGTARTALFNWLFAKHNGGKFIIRIEDTDLERSEKRFEKDILDGLKWLGIESDEKIVRQTERLDIYEKYLKKLLESGNAYYCACTKEELETERQKAIDSGKPPIYSGKCRDKNIAPEKGQVIRFKVPNEIIIFKDLIRGDVRFDMSLMGDIAIAKNLKTPLYNFAVVVDDHEMGISHVIRGEDHLANTPKQIAIQQALGLKSPKYAHLPLILDPDRSKMSKRFSATSVEEYRKLGYLPEALINFIALLGWHSKEEKEIMDIKELIKEFELERVQKAGAVFNTEKLDWINSQYIKNSNFERIKSALSDIFGNKIVFDEITKKIINVAKDRMSKLSEFEEIRKEFLDLLDYPASLLVWKKSSADTAKNNLKVIKDNVENVHEKDFTKENLEKILMFLADKLGRGETLWPLRVSLSGKEKSPGPFELMDVLGKEESLKRINDAIKKLEK
ncbi:MAG: glutamate--tRNA ligase [Candidatus Pacebacteria bacterium]|nr:glutamate--tRNA ligase [Candidatus Paceibacterota bacterium]